MIPFTLRVLESYFHFFKLFYACFIIECDKHSFLPRIIEIICRAAEHAKYLNHAVAAFAFGEVKPSTANVSSSLDHSNAMS